MSVESSFRKSSVQREGDMSTSLALEAQRIVRDAAQPIPPGETIKGQLRRAARALGYGDSSWRIRSAWYGEASSWSATAFEQLRSRHAAWRERQSKSAQAEMDNFKLVYRTLAERLEGTDAEYHSETIAHLRNVLSKIGRPPDVGG